mmetsp:Transcript_19225/g.55915  ORF Transcript_19225/g.55915 Transcript_19225/m.55915 type:complete len:243 (+) Transcript_19225:1638-2366(+)
MPLPFASPPVLLQVVEVVAVARVSDEGPPPPASCSVPEPLASPRRSSGHWSTGSQSTSPSVQTLTHSCAWASSGTDLERPCPRAKDRIQRCRRRRLSSRCCCRCCRHSSPPPSSAWVLTEAKRLSRAGLGSTENSPSVVGVPGTVKGEELCCRRARGGASQPHHCGLSRTIRRTTRAWSRSFACDRASPRRNWRHLPPHTSRMRPTTTRSVLLREEGADGSAALGTQIMSTPRATEARVEAS